MTQKYTQGFRKFLTDVKKSTSDIDLHTPTFKKRIYQKDVDLVTDTSMVKHSPFKEICLKDDNKFDDTKSHHS
jgi:hypothetical protein